MKSYTLFVVLFLLATQSVNAKIRRVGYFGLAVPNTDYANFALAQTAASANDTILIFPGSTASGNITKKLVILGTGNWLDPTSNPKGNSNQQAFASVALGGTLSFLAASDGSIVSGLYFANNSIYVGANNIVIRRNRDVTVNLAYNPNAGGVNTPQTINNLQILENYKLSIANSYNVAGFVQTNLNVSNNFMESFSLGAGLNTYNGNISNNVWVSETTNPAGNGGASSLSASSGISLGNGAFLFQNNILVSYNNAIAASNYNYFIISDGGNTVFNYNVVLQSYNSINMGIGTGNIVVPIANVAAIFDDFPAIGTNTADARYRLKVGSPALAASRPGSPADAGMYGGTAPYKISTLPAIPSIYSLSSPQGNNPTGSTIQINVSAKGNN